MAALVLWLIPTLPAAAGDPAFGAEGHVGADGSDIDVPGYSVPSLVDWNADGVKDLVVGEGSGVDTPKVRVYLNVGTAVQPAFSAFLYAQSEGSDLTVLGGG
jgi:hypothetical protein